MLGEYHGGNFVKKETDCCLLVILMKHRKYYIFIERNQTSSVDHLVHNPNGSLHAEFWICLKKKNRNNVVSCFFNSNWRTIWLLRHSWDDWILNINRFFWKLVVLLVCSSYVNLSIHLQVNEGHTESESESRPGDDGKPHWKFQIPSQICLWWRSLALPPSRYFKVFRN